MDVQFGLPRSAQSMLELNEQSSDFDLFNILVYSVSVNVTTAIILLFLALDSHSLGRVS